MQTEKFDVAMTGVVLPGMCLENVEMLEKERCLSSKTRRNGVVLSDLNGFGGSQDDRGGAMTFFCRCKELCGVV